MPGDLTVIQAMNEPAQPGLAAYDAMLKFFGRTPFFGVVFHSAEALLASERTATPEPPS